MAGAAAMESDVNFCLSLLPILKACSMLADSMKLLLISVSSAESANSDKQEAANSDKREAASPVFGPNAKLFFVGFVLRMSVCSAAAANSDKREAANPDKREAANSVFGLSSKLSLFVGLALICFDSFFSLSNNFFGTLEIKKKSIRIKNNYLFYDQNQLTRKSTSVHG